MKLLSFCNVWRVKRSPGRDLSIAALPVGYLVKTASDTRVERPCREIYAVSVQHWLQGAYLACSAPTSSSTALTYSCVFGVLRLRTGLTGISASLVCTTG